jgi:hypothetical protein
LSITIEGAEYALQDALLESEANSLGRVGKEEEG